jgi:hypothetical protein
MPDLRAESQGNDFKNPPTLGQFQLVVEPTHGIPEFLALFRFETARRVGRSLHFVGEGTIGRFCGVNGLSEFGNYGLSCNKRRRPRDYEGVECAGIEADLFEGFSVELDSSIDDEAFANHPTKRDPG